VADQEEDETEEVYVTTVAGGAVRVSQSETVGCLVLSANWSPDGSRIAFVADHRLIGAREVFVVVPGSPPVPMSDEILADDFSSFLDWTADGSHAVFVLFQSDPPLVRLAADTGDGAPNVDFVESLVGLELIEVR